MKRWLNDWFIPIVLLAALFFAVCGVIFGAVYGLSYLADRGMCERAANRLQSEDWDWGFTTGCWVEYEGRMFPLDAVRAVDIGGDR